MPFPPIKKTLEGLLEDFQTRITLVERRLAKAGGGGGGGGGDYLVRAGLLQPYGGGSVPSGWLVCDGSSVSRSAYPELFSAIGTIWGSASATTFNVPDLRGRTVVGRDISQTEFDVIGETGGAKTHTLTIAELPAHSHPFGYRDNTVGLAAGSIAAQVQATLANDIQVLDDGPPVRNPIKNRGGGGAHNNLQPYAVANWIISTGAGVGGGGTNVPALPDPVVRYGPDSQPINWGSTGWGDLPGTGVTFTLAQPMLVQVDFGGQATVPSAAVYAMIGVVATGALSLQPEYDQALGAVQKFGNTPFTFSSVNTHLHGHKVILLPAGTTTLTMQVRRSGTSVIPNIDYSRFAVTPIDWVGAPSDPVNLTRGTTAQRDAVHGVPATDAQRVALANRQVTWFNTDLGYEESYYATTGLAGLTVRGLITGFTSGWHPTTAGALYAHRGKTNGFQGGIGTTPVEVVLAASQIKRGVINDEGNGGLRLTVAGYYRLTARVYFSGGGTMAYVAASLRVNGSGLIDCNGPSGAADVVQSGTVQYACAANTLVALWAYSAAAQNVFGTGAGFAGSYLEVEYLGPPLANG